MNEEPQVEASTTTTATSTSTSGRNSPSAGDLETASRVLSWIADNELVAPTRSERYLPLFAAAGRVINPKRGVRKERLKAARQARIAQRDSHDNSLRARCGIHKIRRKDVELSMKVAAAAVAPLMDKADKPPPLEGLVEDLDETMADVVDGTSTSTSTTTTTTTGSSNGPKLVQPLSCYICKKKYDTVHHFYDQMCTECANLNESKRNETTDMTGKWAVVTGGRIKIGYHASLRLLRMGCGVVVTTRFPHDAGLRFKSEDDYHQWKDRLIIYGLNMMAIRRVEEFCEEMKNTLPHLDYLINNAAQTLHREPEYHAQLAAQEHRASQLLEDQPERPRLMLPGWRPGAAAPQRLLLTNGPQHVDEEGEEGSEQGQSTTKMVVSELDEEGELIDYRNSNSWRIDLGELETRELLETQVVNVTGPTILTSRLKPLMLKSPAKFKHVIQVSAMEGKFSRGRKTTRHPHTNMAKAALNMLVRTSSPDYALVGILMCAVDTGWVTEENPWERKLRKREQGDSPPLDSIDGAARILDPIISEQQATLAGKEPKLSFGLFLKDYKPTTW